MAIKKEKKIELVEQTVEKLLKAKAVYLTDYLGLSVEEISELRDKLREEEVEFKVIKNSLFKRALDEAKIKLNQDNLSGHPVAVAISYEDEVIPAKVIYQYSKKNDKLEILAGLIDGDEVSDITIKSLANLPGRDELYAKLVGTLSAPISGIVNVTAANIRNLTNVLNSYKESKS